MHNLSIIFATASIQSWRWTARLTKAAESPPDLGNTAYDDELEAIASSSSASIKEEPFSDLESSEENVRYTP